MLRDSLQPTAYSLCQALLRCGEVHLPPPGGQLHRTRLNCRGASRPGSRRLVSNESLHRDRTLKQRLYAASAIPEYWIVALPDHRLEVYRNPARDGYQSVTQHPAGDRIAPLARPDAQILVDDLLP